MKTLACKDLGLAKCDFVAKGETIDDVVNQVYEHANKAHKNKVDEMMTKDNMTTDQVKDMMASKVKEE